MYHREWARVLTATVVALNRAVAASMGQGPEAALAEVDALARDGRLAGYRYLPATRAELLVRLGRTAEAAEAYRIGPWPSAATPPSRSSWPRRPRVAVDR